jgi:ADP-ribose pyrophosphatase YjhB (NUDIX family)
VGALPVKSARVYALAFIRGGDLLLVGGGPGDSGYWLPGGGGEADETPAHALGRELREEAAATLQALRLLGYQQVDDPAQGRRYHAFYWCRVALAAAYRPVCERAPSGGRRPHGIPHPDGERSGVASLCRAAEAQRQRRGQQQTAPKDAE